MNLLELLKLINDLAMIGGAEGGGVGLILFAIFVQVCLQCFSRVIIVLSIWFLHVA
jgi:hypothetical protein